MQLSTQCCVDICYSAFQLSWGQRTIEEGELGTQSQSKGPLSAKGIARDHTVRKQSRSALIFEESTPLTLLIKDCEIYFPSFIGPNWLRVWSEVLFVFIDLQEVKFIHSVGFLGPDCLQSYAALRKTWTNFKEIQKDYCWFRDILAIWILAYHTNHWSIEDSKSH